MTTTQSAMKVYDRILDCTPELMLRLTPAAFLDRALVVAPCCNDI
jgi:hypothetical protein